MQPRSPLRESHKGPIAARAGVVLALAAVILLVAAAPPAGGWDPNLWQGSSIGVQGSGRALAASAAAPQARQCRRHDPTIAQDLGPGIPGARSPSAGGTTEACFSRPYGTCRLLAGLPSSKLLGYSRVVPPALRRWHAG